MPRPVITAPLSWRTLAPRVASVAVTPLCEGAWTVGAAVSRTLSRKDWFVEPVVLVAVMVSVKRKLMLPVLVGVPDRVAVLSPLSTKVTPATENGVGMLNEITSGIPVAEIV